MFCFGEKDGEVAFLVFFLLLMRWPSADTGQDSGRREVTVNTSV